MTSGAGRLPLAVAPRHYHSMHRTRLLMVTAAILGAACSGDDGLTGFKQVDHIELSLDPARPAYPRGDTTVIKVAAFDKNGAQLSTAGVRSEEHTSDLQ